MLTGLRFFYFLFVLLQMPRTAVLKYNVQYCGKNVFYQSLRIKILNNRRWS